MIAPHLFNAIGFTNSSFEELQPHLEKVINDGIKLISTRGIYAYRPLGNGCEVWVALDKENTVVNFDPHYIGSSRIKVRLETLFDVGEDMVGGAKVWTHQPEQGEAEQSFPFMVNIPNWDLVYGNLEHYQRESKQPVIFDLQLTAFAETLACYESAEEYYKAQEAPEDGPRFSSQHFLPIGLFVEKDQFPYPVASFAGTILAARALLNPITQIRTLYLSVQTMNMVVDIVADPTLVVGRPQQGGTIQGRFFLSGRPVFEIQQLQKWMVQNVRA